MTSCCSDDCPVKYGWCPPQANAAAKKFSNELSDLTALFNLALGRYKDTFPPRIVDPTEENISLYQQSKQKLDSIWGQLFSLENSVESAVASINTKLNGDKTNINTLKDRYNVDHSKLEVIRNANLASYPMKREFEQFRLHSYIDLGYYVIGLIIVICLLVKGILGGSPSDIQFVSPNVAKITGIAAAILGGILAVYYR
jgi:hypothetical protein